MVSVTINYHPGGKFYLPHLCPFPLQCSVGVWYFLIFTLNTFKYFFYQCNNLSLSYHLIPSSEREENQHISSCLHPFQLLLVGASVPGWWGCEGRVKSYGSNLSGGSSCSREMRQWQDSPIFFWLLSSAFVYCSLLFIEPECWSFHSAFQDQGPNPLGSRSTNQVSYMGDWSYAWAFSTF